MEKSKLFKQMGQMVGIKATSKSHRGIIARKFMESYKEFKLARFAESCPMFKCGGTYAN